MLKTHEEFSKHIKCYHPQWTTHYTQGTSESEGLWIKGYNRILCAGTRLWNRLMLFLTGDWFSRAGGSFYGVEKPKAPKCFYKYCQIFERTWCVMSIDTMFSIYPVSIFRWSFLNSTEIMRTPPGEFTDLDVGTAGESAWQSSGNCIKKKIKILELLKLFTMGFQNGTPKERSLYNAIRITQPFSKTIMFVVTIFFLDTYPNII